MGQRWRWFACVLAVSCLAAATGCGGGDDDATPRTSPLTSATTATTPSSTTTVDGAKPKYRKAKPDPSLPRQDIDVNIRYPSSFTKEQVAVVQAWTNYRHVFYVTADPPDPDSALFARVTDAQGVIVSRDQRLQLVKDGLVARIPKDGSFRETIVEATVESQSAELVTCQVDSTHQISVTSGSVVNRKVTTKRIRGVIRKLPDGSWRVSIDSLEERRWPGDEEDECFAA